METAALAVVDHYRENGCTMTTSNGAQTRAERDAARAKREAAKEAAGKRFDEAKSGAAKGRARFALGLDEAARRERKDG